MPLAKALGDGRLAVAGPDVPAGKYAKASLTALGVWDAVQTKLAPADNVRGALLFVARGETPLGIVYDTDAKVGAQGQDRRPVPRRQPPGDHLSGRGDGERRQPRGRLLPRVPARARRRGGVQQVRLHRPAEAGPVSTALRCARLARMVVSIELRQLASRPRN